MSDYWGYIISLTAAGLVAKIVFDWLKSRHKDSGLVIKEDCNDYRQGICSQIKSLETRLDRIEEKIDKLLFSFLRGKDK